jgi:hypothetical protein
MAPAAGITVVSPPAPDGFIAGTDYRKSERRPRPDSDGVTDRAQQLRLNPDQVGARLFDLDVQTSVLLSTYTYHCV